MKEKNVFKSTITSIYTIIVFPFEIYIVYKNKGNLLIKSKIKWWQLILIIGVLFGFAGLMGVIITPIEHSLLSNAIDKTTKIMPAYDNMFRIIVFMFPSVLAYKYNDIRISIGFHCACNLFSTISFIMTVL